MIARTDRFPYKLAILIPVTKKKTASNNRAQGIHNKATERKKIVRRTLLSKNKYTFKPQSRFKLMEFYQPMLNLFCSIILGRFVVRF